MKIAFLIHNVYGVGGTIRTTLNLAAALAERHEVEIVSMNRHRTVPRFEIDGRIAVTPLVDLRSGSDDADDPRLRMAAEVFPRAESRYKQYSRLHDQRARDWLRACEADVIIGTRPGINVYLARWAPAAALRIAQEHLFHDHHSKRLRAVLAEEYRALDALVTTTEADAAVYRRRMELPGVHIASVPNSVPVSGLTEPAELARADEEGTPKVLAAAGRLVRSKGYELLIRAFGDVAPKHPEWRLRIYGAGSDQQRLQELIEELGLQQRAELRGFASPIEAEFAKAALVGVASEAESFGMTLVEAMRCGVPVVSTDCPLGPAEIVDDGVNGRLVPVGDREGYARALHELMGDDATRHRMARAALETSQRYDPEPIARRYDALFAELVACRRARAKERRKELWRSRIRRLRRRLGR